MTILQRIRKMTKAKVIQVVIIMVMTNTKNPRKILTMIMTTTRRNAKMEIPKRTESTNTIAIATTTIKKKVMTTIKEKVIQAMNRMVMTNTKNLRKILNTTIMDYIWDA